MDFGIVLIVAIVFIGAPLSVLGGISMIRRTGIEKKRLEFEREHLEVERQKLRLLQLQAENRLLDRKLEDEFRSEGFTGE
jgi:hypothetical protein